MADALPFALAPADACPMTPHGFRQPVLVVEDAGLERYPPIVAFPMPFPRGAGLRSLAGFRGETADGRPLPSQLEVLSRWGEAPDTCAAPIRWAYAFTRAQVPASTRAYLSLGKASAGQPDPEVTGPSIRLTEDQGAIYVDTGPARFTVRKDWFLGLSRVELMDGEQLRPVVDVPADGRGGMLVERPFGFSGQRAPGGLASPLFGPRGRLEVERRGPLVATVAVRGRYGRPGEAPSFRYTVRLSFYAGTAVVLFDHTYGNGETTDDTAHGGKNRAVSDRVLLRLPLALGAAPEVLVRAAEQVHRLTPTSTVVLEQQKRSPLRPDPVASVRHGDGALELTPFAERPFLAVRGGEAWAAATIAHLGARDPQALRFVPDPPALEIDWQSEELFVGGARGVWSRAALDFGLASGAPDLILRGAQLYAHASRPLIGAPDPAYLGESGAWLALPKGELDGPFADFDQDVDRVHAGTTRFLRRARITGTQLWPDLPRTACREDACPPYFEGGDDNYWDWSHVELQQFLRSADPVFLHDFALPEALTMAETISFRPDPEGKGRTSSFAGFSPCYGGGRNQDDGVWAEGLNHRRGACPGDYSYNKVHQLAYVLTADRRFLDLFSEGAETALRLYKSPPKTRPDKWLELSASRTTTQYLEPLLDAAEFDRDPARAARYRAGARAYFDHLAKNALERGHTCELLGTGQDDPRRARSCLSTQAWMLPPWVDWVARLSRLLPHPPAEAWLLELGRQSARRHTTLDEQGRPDHAVALDPARGWRTVYRCKAGPQGIDDASCAQITTLENQGLFYPNGLVAYLNVYGQILALDPADPLGLCAWLPQAFAGALAGMRGLDNGGVWGKELGQAHAFTQVTLGALERCPR